MSPRTKSMTNKKTSSNINDKIAIRREAVKGLKEIKVLDCFHAKGELWNRMTSYRTINDLLGIEKNKHLKSVNKVVYGNNLQVMSKIDIDHYNVIDLDAYGSPLEQMEIVFKRAKKPKIVIYTFCFSGLSGIPNIMVVDKRITERCKTILNSYFDDMFSYYLHRHGVKEYKEIVYVSRGMRKHYGYFYYNPIDKT